MSISVMMTISRYVCAVVILIVASLTPSSCSDVAEQAMAYEEAESVVIDGMTVDRSARSAELKFEMASDSDADRTGS